MRRSSAMNQPTSNIISVITPLHAAGNPFIGETYESLSAQTDSVWEWVIVENNGGVVPEKIRRDERVKVMQLESSLIGLLKRSACEAAIGLAIVELDADDLLHPSAIERVRAAFASHESPDFVFSDFAEFQHAPLTPQIPYNARFGWSYYPTSLRGTALAAMRSPEATEHNVRLVDWAPNHLRAWRAESYWRAGGHDRNMAVGDDHDLIVRMLLGRSKFFHIPECLYFYRVHGSNTVTTKNATIRDATMGVYNRHIWNLAENWTRRKRLLRVDLCGGLDVPPGYISIDRRIHKSGDIACDLDGRWELADSSVGLLRAYDAVEHLRDPIHTMNEAYRVLAPGGWLMIHVPSTNGLGAFSDPTHKSFWNKLSFRHYADPAIARYTPEFVGRFQVSRILEWFPTDWHRENNVPYVEAHLISCKDGFRAMGEYLWPDDNAVSGKSADLGQSANG